MTSDTTKDSHLSIGAISNSTGIPAATLRTWERRYGFPNPDRNDAGHRVYPADIVEHLEMISKALDRGHRASNVVGLSKDELRSILDVNGEANQANSAGQKGQKEQKGQKNGTTRNGAEPQADSRHESNPSRRPESGSVPSIQSLDDVASDAKDEESSQRSWSDEEQPEWMNEWMAAVDNLDGELLDLYFRNAWNRMGGLDFIRYRAAPFLQELGRRWQMGDLDVAHEHYTSQCLQDFMSTHWRPLSDRNEGPSVICATFSGEQHALGLHFAAIVLAMAGWHIVFLGPSTPHRDILRTAEIKDVDAVLVSVSSAFNSLVANRELEDLRDALPDDIDLLVGGGGAEGDTVANLENTLNFDSLMDFYEWAIAQIR